MEKTVLVKIENKVRQQLFGMISLAVAGLMILNSLGISTYGALDTTDLSFNVTGGALTIGNAPATMNFTNQAFGSSSANLKSNEFINGLYVSDYRGSYTAWVTAVNANNLQSGSDIIEANKLTVYQNAGTLTNLQNCTTTYIALGATDTLEGSGATLMNGSTQASGIVQFDNGYVNLLYSSTIATGTYTGVLVFTVT
jgi:hypothetical protein